MRASATLELLDESNRPLLSAWLHRPHVSRWYPEPEANVAWATCPPNGGAHELIVCDTRPVDYIRWQVVYRETLDSVGLFEIPTNSVDVDLLRGESEYLGKRLGRAPLAQFADRLRGNAVVPLVGLTSSVENYHADRAFEKAGFVIARQYAPVGFGLCHLFVLPLWPE